MRRIVQAAFAVALAALHPAPAAAGEYGGALGVRYTRSETWAPQQYELTPRLQLNGNLAARGDVGSPDLLRWSGSVAYEGVRETYQETAGSSDGLTYVLRLGAFEKRNSAFTASGSVSRTETDSVTEAPDGSSSTGLTRTDAYDVGLTVSGGDRPALSVRGLHRESSNAGFGRETVEDTVDQIALGFRHGPGPYNVSGTYTGTWNEGTLFLSNYALHTLGLNASATLGATSTAQLTTTSQRRIPESNDPRNPTTESNSVQSGVEWLRGGGARGRVTYSYIHTLATATALESRELFSHGLGVGLEQRFSAAWSGFATVGVQFSRSRLAAYEETSAGQSLALSALWHGTSKDGSLSTDVEAGPKVGLLEPVEGPAETGYGGLARTRVTLRRADVRYGLDYAFDYERDLGGRPGWVMRQQLHADAETLVGRDLRLRAILTGTGLRQDFRPFGANASRSATLSGTAAIPNYSLTLEVGLSDGLQAGLAGSIQGDGLFFPESYDTSSRYASLIGTARIARRLGFTAMVRYATQSGADLPAQRQASATGMLSYSLGLFQLSIEDRYVAGGATGFDQRSNLIFATLTRSFGGRW